MFPIRFPGPLSIEQGRGVLNQISVRVEPQSWRCRVAAHMLDIVTVEAKRLKVRPIESNRQIANVFGVYVPFMVDYARKPAAPFTNVMLACHIRRLRIAPRPTAVEPARIVLCHSLLPLAGIRPRPDRQHLQDTVDCALEPFCFRLFSVIPQRQQELRGCFR